MAEEIPNKELVDKFVKKIIKYSDEDKATISAAAVFAAKKHGDQRRKTNQPYITHPIAVAEILMQIGMDADTVSAGLLHDTLEDTDTTEDEIATLFGKEVGEMVQAVTKISRITDEKSIQEAETIKKTAFRVTRMGQLVAQEASSRLGVPFGIVDLSLAPTPAIGDRVARILEEMGLEVCGTHGTTAALALLNDAVKKGGVMASSSVGGLSGAFIPVSEDEGMIAAARSGALTLEKLEAMTCVCSVGLDMIAVPGDTTTATISAIIADEAAIGMINQKTTAVRIIPAPGMKVGDTVEFGGLLGSAPVMPCHTGSAEEFVARGGRIPAPMHSLKN